LKNASTSREITLIHVNVKRMGKVRKGGEKTWSLAQKFRSKGERNPQAHMEKTWSLAQKVRSKGERNPQAHMRKETIRIL
jgi:hypothetical protein